ncbi:MAG: dihydrofolate reductase, partial [Glaciihabitans sp.]|nr:dihydrofolate reductase [Glaciihabitans sp.]
PKAKEGPVGKVVMYGSVSVDGFVADENDQPGPLFDWLSSGDVSLDESDEVKVSQSSYDYTRRVDHVVVVTHRPKPAGWDQRRRFTSSTASRQPWPRRGSWRVTASSRSQLATSVARCLPRAWSTRCGWTSYQ